jgi:prepilin-type N-terminal cleavage/methylation domain-containing protein
MQRPFVLGLRPVRRKGTRGFTLTELMATIAIMGILATIGIASLQRQTNSSRLAEASAVVQAIRAAEEAYRAENQVYLDVSSDSSAWFPAAPTAGERRAFYPSSHADLVLWRRLGPRVAQPVQFGFLVNAGLPSADADVLPTLACADFSYGTRIPTEPWFVIQARADADGDGKYFEVFTTSFEPELRTSGEGE